MSKLPTKPQGEKPLSPPPPPYYGATFETKDGLSFTRAEGGGVVVHLPGASEQAELGEAFVVLDAGIWSRVVALMKPEYAWKEDEHPALAASRGAEYLRRKAEQ